MAKTKVTFKKDARETGLRAVGYYRGYDIKIKKKTFGRITTPNVIRREFTWEIMYAIEKEDIMQDGNPNCSWMWKRAESKFDSAEMAKQWIQDNIYSILDKFT